MANNAQRATAGHLQTFLANPTLPDIEVAIRALVPSGKHAEIVALFEYRVPYSCIREWRRGRVQAPQWARDLCRQAVAPYVAIDARLATPTCSKGYQPNILTWHARKKEEAGNKAGP